MARPGTYKTLADIMAASKAKPGGLNYGSPGLGTIPHLSMAELSQISKVAVQPRAVQGPGRVDPDDDGGPDRFRGGAADRGGEQRARHAGAVCREAQSVDPDVPTVKEQGFDVAPLEHRRTAGAGRPAGRHQEETGAACIAAKDSEPFQRIVKTTLQPSDYFADSAGFAANLEQGCRGQAAAADRAGDGEELGFEMAAREQPPHQPADRPEQDRHRVEHTRHQCHGGSRRNSGVEGEQYADQPDTSAPATPARSSLRYRGSRIGRRRPA